MQTATSFLQALCASWRGALSPRHGGVLGAACALLLLVACGDTEFKRCEVSVQSIRPSRVMPAALLVTLREMLHGSEAQSSPRRLLSSVQLLVTPNVANPDGRSVEIRALSGVISTDGGMLGTFRLPPGTSATLLTGDTTRLDVEIQPDEAGFHLALPLMLPGGKPSEVKASGVVEVSTWLGGKRIPFKNITIIRDNAPHPSDRTENSVEGAV